MAFTAERLTCPCCGFAVAVGDTECPAGHPLAITSFHSVASMPLPMVNKYANTYRKDLAEAPDDQSLNFSVGICYMKLKLYDKALPAFEKAMVDNFDNSEAFFYAAVCQLGGKKPFLNSRPVIDKAEEYLNAALMIEERGIYYYFLAYIKSDYYERKYLKVSPNSAQTMQTALAYGVSEADKSLLFEMLNVDRPANM